jgi:polyisoprenoid-binding protein YceI
LALTFKECNLTVKGVTKLASMTVTSFQAMPHLIHKKDSIGVNTVVRIPPQTRHLFHYQTRHYIA